MKNKMWKIICFFIVYILLLIPIATAIETHSIQLDSKNLTSEIDTADNSPSFPPEFLFIIGRYTSVEVEQNGIFSRSLIIHCNA